MPANAGPPRTEHLTTMSMNNHLAALLTAAGLLAATTAASTNNPLRAMKISAMFQQKYLPVPDSTAEEEVPAAASTSFQPTADGAADMLSLSWAVLEKPETSTSHQIVQPCPSAGSSCLGG